MTSKQYYKQTSDMAYPLDNVMEDTNDPNLIIANIGPLSVKNEYDAAKILEENDFFSLPSDFNFDKIDTDHVKLEIRFHYGIDNYDRYSLYVCDVIDCTYADGGKIVLSCDGFEQIDSCRPDKGADTNVATAEQHRNKSIFDLFDDIVGCSSSLKDLFSIPSFPKFPDITKMIEETRKNIENGIDKSKNDGSSKFYNFSCKIDPDGKVHIKRSSNDGTVEKEFNLGDKTSSAAKKIEIKEDSDPKTELRNLIK